MDNWAEYFYGEIDRKKFDEREEMYQAFTERMKAEGLIEKTGDTE